MRKPTESAESICQAVAEAVRAGGASPCPPVVVGVGIGGTADSCSGASKKALIRDLDELRIRIPSTLELEAAMLYPDHMHSV
jgi:fumarate hydratase subunit alpha